MIKQLKKILPGPKHGEIDYKQNKYEILDEHDQTDFNPKETGGRKSQREEGGDQPLKTSYHRYMYYVLICMNYIGMFVQNYGTQLGSFRTFLF